MAEMGPRSVANMVFVVLLAGALVFGLYLFWNMAEAAMSGVG